LVPSLRDAHHGSAEARQLTSGEFETGFGSWSSDSKRIAFYDNQASPMERFVRVVDVETGQIEPVVTQKGVNYLPRFSPDGRRVVLERTDPESSVDLYVADVEANGALTRLTDSMPGEIKTSDLTPPEPVYFRSRVDGKEVPASLFVRKGLDRSRKHPAVVWIHGSGSDQNFLGWHPFSYRMYYSANQYLAQQGYVILAVDYRGSSGYGRDWGTGHHLDLGGPDALDVASGADYLKTLPYVDPDRGLGAELRRLLDFASADSDPCLVPVRDQCRRRQRLGHLGAGVQRRLDHRQDEHTEGQPRRLPSQRFHQAHGDFGEALADPPRHGRRQRGVPGVTELDRRSVENGKGLRLRGLSRGAPFFRRAHILRDAWRRAERFFDTHLKAEELMVSH